MTTDPTSQGHAASLLQMRRYMESAAITDRALGKEGREWLDLLTLMDRAEVEVAARVAAARAEALREAAQIADDFAASEMARLAWSGGPGLIGNWVGAIRETATEIRAVVSREPGEGDKP